MTTVKQLGSQKSRFLVAAAPAAVITAGLFLGMKLMLNEDVVPLASTEPARVLKIDYAEPEPEQKIRTRRVEPIEAAKAPPPPAKLTMTKADIDFQPISMTGSAPEPLKLGRLDEFAVTPIAIDERDAQPIRPPVPVYPTRALTRGLEGACEVRFDVTAKGRPYNIVPMCSHSVFDDAAKMAVSKSEFLPRVVSGQVIERRNVVYPIEFKIKS